MNPTQRHIIRAFGFYAFFSVMFAFLIPPIGFLMAYHGYKKDKAIGERYGGWIFIMIIAVFATIVYVAALIALAVNGGGQ